MTFATVTSAKLAELEVDTLNVDYDAVTGFASNTTFAANQDVVADNPKGLPVQLFWQVNVSVQTGSPGTASVTSIITRTRGGVEYFRRTGNWGNGGNANFVINGATVDADAQAGDTYRFATSTSQSGQGTIVQLTGKRITAAWVKA